MINPQIEQLFQNELKPGESLKWSAAPNPSRLMRKALPIALFGIPFTAFAIFWITMACEGAAHSPHDAFIFFPLFGIPFVLVGLGILTSPLWVARQAKSTGYFVTSQRALIIQRKFFGGFDIRSYYPAQLARLERVQQADGSGDIILDRVIQRSGNGVRTTEIGFFGIPSVRSVESLLTSLNQKAGQ